MKSLIKLIQMPLVVLFESAPHTVCAFVALAQLLMIARLKLLLLPISLFARLYWVLPNLLVALWRHAIPLAIQTEYVLVLAVI